MKKLLVVVFTIFTICAQAQFIFVFLNKKLDAEKLSEEQSKKIMEGHFGNMERLAKEKKLVAAGPFEGGGGIFILNTTSMDSAKFWINPDAGIKANRWNVELLPYSPRVGNVCAVSAPYTMVDYSFVRFTFDKSKAGSKKANKDHDRFLKKFAKSPEVITEGIFANSGGGILVMKTEPKKEELETDPAFKSEEMTYDIKKLFIAKGSFCEK